MGYGIDPPYKWGLICEPADWASNVLQQCIVLTGTHPFAVDLQLLFIRTTVTNFSTFPIPFKETSNFCTEWNVTSKTTLSPPLSYALTHNAYRHVRHYVQTPETLDLYALATETSKIICSTPLFRRFKTWLYIIFKA